MYRKNNKFSSSGSCYFYIRRSNGNYNVIVAVFVEKYFA